MQNIEKWENFMLNSNSLEALHSGVKSTQKKDTVAS